MKKLKIDFNLNIISIKKIVVGLMLVGALVGCKNKSGKTSSSLTQDKVKNEVAAEMTQKVFSAEEYQVFMTAALEGNVEQVKVEIAKGMDVNYNDPEMKPALMLASYNGHSEIVKLLLDHGADVNIVDKMHSSALMFASSGPFIETVKILLAAGTDVNCKDNNEHWTPAMWAASEGHTEVLKVLIAAGADYTHVNIDGESCYDFAISNHHPETAAYLKTLAEIKNKIYWNI